MRRWLPGAVSDTVACGLRDAAESGYLTLSHAGERDAGWRFRYMTLSHGGCMTLSDRPIWPGQRWVRAMAAIGSRYMTLSHGTVRTALPERAI